MDGYGLEVVEKIRRGMPVAYPLPRSPNIERFNHNREDDGLAGNLAREIFRRPSGNIWSERYLVDGENDIDAAICIEKSAHGALEVHRSQNTTEPNIVEDMRIGPLQSRSKLVLDGFPSIHVPMNRSRLSGVSRTYDQNSISPPTYHSHVFTAEVPVE